MNTSLILINVLVGPTLLLLALIYKIFPPKKINWVYGYRTNRSRKSQETWDAANKYSADLMVWTGIITSISQVILNLFLNANTSLVISCSIMCTLLVGMMFLIEKYLEDNFDDEGKRKS